ncbi:MAG: PEP-CTERM sorting domain-containing protein [Myxococcota bacterium]
MRLLCALIATLALTATSAGAHTLSISIVDNSSCNPGTCSQNGSGLADDWGMVWNSSASGASFGGGSGSSGSGTLAFNAGVAADDGGDLDGDRNVVLSVSFDITLDIDVAGSTAWELDISQSVLGLFALRGDGTASAVGNQDDSLASITTIANSLTGGFSASPTSYQEDCSNNCQKSQQFTGGRNDLTVLSGSGDFDTTFTVSFDLRALSNNGCSGFICSSASGGEEAGVLFGVDDVTDQAVDNYSTWGRSLTPDGYNASFTLNIVPEPATALLTLVGLAGIGAARRRPRR